MHELDDEQQNQTTAATSTSILNEDLKSQENGPETSNFWVVK